MQVIKVTNPLAVSSIAPLVQEFVEKVEMPNVSYHSMVTLLQGTAQFGGDGAEVWVALDDEQNPVGFARWYVMEMPFVGSVYWNYAYSKKKGAMSLFVDEFLKFAEARRAPYVMFDAVNEKMEKHFLKLAAERKLTGGPTQHVRCLLRRTV